MKKIALSLVLFLGALCFIPLPSTIATAGVIADRATLDALLGASEVTENFEAFSIAPGGSTFLGITSLNAGTTTLGQGPGLVVPGVQFGSPTNLQWNGAGYFGQPSKDILGYNPLAINFAIPTNAFGLDLLAFKGYPETATVTIYGADDISEIAKISGIGLPSSASPIFFGYSDNSGIGKVLLEQQPDRWSPIIDNLSFGTPTPIPEPATMLLLGSGLIGLGVYWRKKFLKK